MKCSQWQTIILSISRWWWVSKIAMQYTRLCPWPDTHATVCHSLIISQYDTRHNMRWHCAVLFLSDLNFLPFSLSCFYSSSLLISLLPYLSPSLHYYALSCILTFLPFSFPYLLFLPLYYSSNVIFLPTSRTIASHYITILDWKP